MEKLYRKLWRAPTWVATHSSMPTIHRPLPNQPFGFHIRWPPQCAEDAHPNNLAEASGVGYFFTFPFFFLSHLPGLVQWASPQEISRRIIPVTLASNMHLQLVMEFETQ